ncbi:MAG: hypothetical protein KIG74_03285 [Clostridiaceae bacterium]|nr:hypothetical protein [Clostridiaceae bacterium]
MANLLHQKWFKPALLALLVILQLALLFTTTFLRPPFTESEDAYLLLAQAPAAESTADGAQETTHASSNVAANCAAWGVAPLYPLLLHASCRILPETIAPGAMNLLFFILTWIVLYAAARRLLPDRWDAALVPLIYGFTAAAALTVRSCGPYMLAAFFAAMLLLLLAAIQKKPRGKLQHVVLFFTILGGFLTVYEFLLLVLGLCAVYGVYCGMRRCWSGLATTLVSAAAALLSAIVLYPACIEHFAANTALFALNYPARLHVLYDGISDALFGGMFTPVLVIFTLLLAAAAFFRAAAPKKVPAAPVSAAVHAGNETEVPHHASAGDPAEAAYQRRIARRTEEPRKKHRKRMGDAISLYIMLALVILVYLLLLPLSHSIPITYSPHTYEQIQTVPQAELCWMVAPLLVFFSTSLLYRSIPAIGGNHRAAVLITAGFFFALAIISFVLCPIFAQSSAAWLFRA